MVATGKQDLTLGPGTNIFVLFTLLKAFAFEQSYLKAAPLSLMSQLLHLTNW
jgi:hypothetical protein